MNEVAPNSPSVPCTSSTPFENLHFHLDTASRRVLDSVSHPITEQTTLKETTLQFDSSIHLSQDTQACILSIVSSSSPCPATTPQLPPPTPNGTLMATRQLLLLSAPLDFSSLACKCCSAGLLSEGAHKAPQVSSFIQLSFTQADLELYRISYRQARNRTTMVWWKCITNALTESRIQSSIYCILVLDSMSLSLNYPKCRRFHACTSSKLYLMASVDISPLDLPFSSLLSPTPLIYRYSYLISTYLHTIFIWVPLTISVRALTESSLPYSIHIRMENPHAQRRDSNTIPVPVCTYGMHPSYQRAHHPAGRGGPRDAMIAIAEASHLQNASLHPFPVPDHTTPCNPASLGARQTSSSAPPSPCIAFACGHLALIRIPDTRTATVRFHLYRATDFASVSRFPLELETGGRTGHIRSY
ncbi:uncharacterized protein BDR25DRAFT_358874 [Lindgomyces ingoldianus]|uniref:Uncharacterized protein n=1 Tax=Lindgomyces ingoldianus TaxID=673940 RepID=A0ACB6QKC4_9PLEO|nr:uncharacterized protein BDR25DRAFT_358874 [Lindgomyces ingoldianus]KAF2467336.1 hypothetical protein BDR25DRAFT_358874 [Lindgomyces ingoldianus]